MRLYSEGACADFYTVLPKTLVHGEGAVVTSQGIYDSTEWKSERLDISCAILVGTAA